MRRSLSFAPATLFFAAVALIACGGNPTETDGGESDGGNTRPDGGTQKDAGGGSFDAGPVPGALQVQVVTLGGSLLTAPKVQLIGYTVDPFLPQAESFLAEYDSTGAWATQVSEYGVGSYAILPTVSIPGTPPTTIDDNTGNVTPLMQMIATAVKTPDSGWAPADPGTFYVLLLPQGTQVNSGGLCCDPTAGYFGYHFQAPLDAGYIPYAVVCNCQNFVTPPLTALDEVTSTINHEMVETVSDPFSATTPAYIQEDNADAIWDLFSFGGELADMCQNNSDSTVSMDGGTFDGGTFKLQRTWSNAAALAGDNPCVPAPAAPYFNSYAVYSDSITLTGSDFGTGGLPTTGLQMTVGQTKTIPVKLWSNAPTGPWTVTAADLSEYLGDSMTPATTLVLDAGQGVAGDELSLTITWTTNDASLGGAGVILVSDYNGQQNFSVFAIGQ